MSPTSQTFVPPSSVDSAARISPELKHSISAYRSRRRNEMQTPSSTEGSTFVGSMSNSADLSRTSYANMIARSFGGVSHCECQCFPRDRIREIAVMCFFIHGTPLYGTSCGNRPLATCNLRPTPVGGVGDVRSIAGARFQKGLVSDAASVILVQSPNPMAFACRNVCEPSHDPLSSSIDPINRTVRLVCLRTAPRDHLQLDCFTTVFTAQNVRRFDTESALLVWHAEAERASTAFWRREVTVAWRRNKHVKDITPVGNAVPGSPLLDDVHVHQFALNNRRPLQLLIVEEFKKLRPV